MATRARKCIPRCALDTVNTLFNKKEIVWSRTILTLPGRRKKVLQLSLLRTHSLALAQELRPTRALYC